MFTHNISIWSAVLLIGVFNGIVLIAYLIFSDRIKKSEDKILLLFILTLVLISLENAVEYSGGFRVVPHLMYITAPLLFAVGPLLYLYHLEKFDSLPNSAVKILLHFIPVLLIIIYMLQFYLLPGDLKINYFVNLHNSAERVIGPRHLIVVLLFQMQIIAYLFFSMNKFKTFSLQIKNESANTIIEQLRGINLLYTFLLLIFTFSFITQILLFYKSEFYETADQLESLIFSFLIHGTLFLMILFPQNTFPSIYKEKVNKQIPGDEDLEKIKQKILDVMRTNKLYLNPSLKLDNIADEIGETRHVTSRIINKYLGSNFYDFVNKYRVEWAIALINSEETKNHSLDSVALESGFNSYISFYRVFKRFTNKSPSEYIN